ncbi:hypothetical protein CHLNCDRAFT_138393 [Chlorella variabilis]|uniref:ATP-dependent DNA ligase family profile domain-containing protein n=1 Tax=Chlorella variabilis TaxID=554065 RepID=E1ZMY8_CHLVA|nr:hypothetical protein CHLNCDRAFT_138393 [Chlorella variabilis]EFN52774.1 hypothetical protein CHLNCDRAFT_138393 [Chlorella variabilis]|eukprot:XP_005844876.1 hypothetical protein CHLNCDRAFT_138393 [Chlorella variabilis]
MEGQHRLAPGQISFQTVVEFLADVKTLDSHRGAYMLKHRNCMDAQKVFNELLDPEVAASVEVWPGKPASPQVGLALHSVKAVVQMMQYHFNQAQLQFLIEPKIDGERQQIHVVGRDRIHYWSRRGIDHGPQQRAGGAGGSGGYCVLDHIFRKQVTAGSVILDGELVIWNTKR